jgi:NADH-quinone oxidoreductase subunit G
MRDVLTAPAILLIGNDPTNQHPLLAWQIRTNVRLRRAKLYVINSAPIKLRRQATAFAMVPAGAEAKAVAFLAGDDSLLDSLVSDATNRDAWIALREKIRAEQNIVIAFGSELRGQDVAKLVSFAESLTGAKLICLGDYANSRGASEMGLYPDLLPGYEPIASAGKFQKEWGDLPVEKGLSLPEMVEAAKAGKLKALYVLGSNPVGRLGIDPFVLSKSFVVVQDMFLTETANIADVVLPAANAYEKTGTYTNTCGDLQLVKKAGEVSNTKPDFEMIVRIADAMGFDVSGLVPFGSGTHSDMGQSRGAQSGEADRHAVWLEAHNLEPKMTPFDPMAILDEIQRVVAGYDISRVNLLAGNDQHLEIAESGASAIQPPELIVPARDDLFSSGTLGRYSKTLNSVFENKSAVPEVAAD